MAQDNFRDVPGELKDNYVDLHHSTGEAYNSIADRVASPLVLDSLDDAGRAGVKRLAEWLRTQTDNAEVMEAFRPPPPPPDPNAPATLQAQFADLQAKFAVLQTQVGSGPSGKAGGRAGA